MTIPTSDDVVADLQQRSERVSEKTWTIYRCCECGKQGTVGFNHVWAWHRHYCVSCTQKIAKCFKERNAS